MRRTLITRTSSVVSQEGPNLTISSTEKHEEIVSSVLHESSESSESLPESSVPKSESSQSSSSQSSSSLPSSVPESESSSSSSQPSEEEEEIVREWNIPGIIVLVTLLIFILYGLPSIPNLPNIPDIPVDDFPVDSYLDDFSDQISEFFYQLEYLAFKLEYVFQDMMMIGDTLYDFDSF